MKPYYKNELTTIYNGDCLEVMDYLIEQGIKVDAIITDPPYGTTACSWDNVIPFDKMWERLKLLRKDKTPIVLFGSEPFSSHMRMSNIKEFKYDWIWEKEQGANFMNLKYQPSKIHEVTSVFYKHNYYPQMGSGKAYKVKRSGVSEITNVKRTDGENKGERFPTSIIKYNTQKDGIHPTQKPLELMKYLIETYTKKGDVILDFTSGSFTTCVGAEQLNRRSIGIELEQKYCDVGVKRLSQLQMRLDI
jgi:site-specific DNA-methyltransferase (adenine-specific)